MNSGRWLNSTLPPHASSPGWSLPVWHAPWYDNLQSNDRPPQTRDTESRWEWAEIRVMPFNTQSIFGVRWRRKGQAVWNYPNTHSPSTRPKIISTVPSPPSSPNIFFIYEVLRSCGSVRSKDRRKPKNAGGAVKSIPARPFNSPAFFLAFSPDRQTRKGQAQRLCVFFEVHEPIIASQLKCKETWRGLAYLLLYESA